MEHLKESRSGKQAEAKDISTQAEQILSLLERRGIVEDQSITNQKAREAEQELRRNMYHNTQMMLKHYRDIVWALECFPQQVAEELGIRLLSFPSTTLISSKFPIRSFQKISSGASLPALILTVLGSPSNTNPSTVAISRAVTVVPGSNPSITISPAGFV